ncbi:hypothetical protein Bca52824_019046 [Brassica carinata]|uniref:Uncharacterized protein n=1 Tax=Brassica carinata TaxID=52824 RepID=A0A8X8AWZ7_BRACI|nr:hypothetical protein Bca52824_019046 [Brassica carinata]
MSGPDRAVELVGLSWSDSDKPVGLVIRAQLVYVRISRTAKAVRQQLEPLGVTEKLSRRLAERETVQDGYRSVGTRGSSYKVTVLGLETVQPLIKMVFRDRKGSLPTGWRDGLEEGNREKHREMIQIGKSWRKAIETSRAVANCSVRSGTVRSVVDPWRRIDDPAAGPRESSDCPSGRRWTDGFVRESKAMYCVDRDGCTERTPVRLWIGIKRILQLMSGSMWIWTDRGG